MANNEHLHSATATLSNGGTAGSSYVAYVDLKEIDPPEMSKGKSKDTSLDSANRTHEYAFDTWIEPGESNVIFYFHKTQMASLIALFSATTTSKQYWKITAPLLSTESTPSNLVFRGGLIKLKWDKMSVDSDDRIMMPATIGVSGLPAFTAGT